MKTIELVPTGNTILHKNHLLGVMGTTENGEIINLGLLEDAQSSNPILRLYSPCSIDTANLILKAVLEQMAGGKPVAPERSLSREAHLVMQVHDLQETVQARDKSLKELSLSYESLEKAYEKREKELLEVSRQADNARKLIDLEGVRNWVVECRESVAHDGKGHHDFRTYDILGPFTEHEADEVALRMARGKDVHFQNFAIKQLNRYDGQLTK